MDQDYIAQDAGGNELLRITYDPQQRVAALFPPGSSLVLSVDERGIWVSLEWPVNDQGGPATG